MVLGQLTEYRISKIRKSCYKEEEKQTRCRSDSAEVLPDTK